MDKRAIDIFSSRGPFIPKFTPLRKHDTLNNSQLPNNRAMITPAAPLKQGIPSITSVQKSEPRQPLPIVATKDMKKPLMSQKGIENLIGSSLTKEEKRDEDGKLKSAYVSPKAGQEGYIAPTAFDKIGNFVSNTKRDSAYVGEIPISRHKELTSSAGEDAYGDDVIRVNRPMTSLSEMKNPDLNTDGGMLTVQDFQNATPEQAQRVINYQENQEVHPFTSPLIAAETIKNVNSTIANLRKDTADDPTTSEDDSEVTYTTPLGEKFTAEERVAYVTLKDGTAITASDYDQMLKQLDKKEGIDVARLPDGTIFTKEDLMKAVEWGDSDHLMLENGAVYSRDELLNAELVGMHTPDGTQVMLADLPRTDEEFKEAWTLRSPSGDTILMYADGTVPEELNGTLMSNQDEDRGFLNMKVDDPRAPWQDKAGNNVFSALWAPFTGEDYKYDISNSAIDEILPWLTDATLQSLPYFIPYYNYVTAAAEAMPYMYGLDGSTYTAPGKSTLDRLSNLGEAGTYADDDITLSQAVGGITAPPIDAFAERFGGSAIGGSGFKILNKTKPGKVLGSALWEGLEELASAPSQLLTEDGLLHYGMEKHYNPETGEFEYDMSSAGGFLSGPALSSYADNFLAGTALGGALESVKTGASSVRARTPLRRKPSSRPDALVSSPLYRNGMSMRDFLEENGLGDMSEEMLERLAREGHLDISYEDGDF